MSARMKLNVACLNGCLVIAALLGLSAGSWPVFLAALVVTLAGSLPSRLRMDFSPQLVAPDAATINE